MGLGSFWKSGALYRAALFACGFLLSWLPLVLAAPTLPITDELFQALEQGHRLAFGYGMVAWEFDYGARSWALPWLAALPMGLAGFLGQGPDVYLPLTWGFFALGAGVMTLCAGLWGTRFYGRWGGLGVALVTAGWIDNLYFGGRAMSEVVGVHLLIAAVFLADPGNGAGNRNRLAAAGFIATLAAMLRMQLGPVALLLWLWRWRDRRGVLLLSAGAIGALALTALFDALTWSYPFQPIWQNIQFNLVLDGAAVFGTDPWWRYFADFWERWGAMSIPFVALALLGARRLPILGLMALVTLAIHCVIPHKEYRFIVPAVMMASILFGLGVVEAARALARLLQRPLQDMAGAAAVALIAALWLIGTAAGLAVMRDDQPWQARSSLLEMTLELARRPAICGVGITNENPYNTGGYTFLHHRVPLFFDRNDANGVNAFVADAKSFNALVVFRDNLAFYAGIPAFADYALDHCAKDHCLLLRPGACEAAPRPRPPLRPLWPRVAYEGDYPYAAGIP